MKNLFVVTFMIEVGEGAALVCWPLTFVALLIGDLPNTLPAIAMGRIGGTALLALGIANGFAHFDQRSATARGLATAMLIYNFGTALILASTGFQADRVAIALWPAVVLHLIMAVWCVTFLRTRLRGK